MLPVQLPPPPPPHLLQPPPLLLLLLDALLPLGQQQALVLLVLLLFQLLPPLRLRALCVGYLEAQEVPPQRGLARDIDDGAGLSHVAFLVLIFAAAVLVLRLVCEESKGKNEKKTEGTR